MLPLGMLENSSRVRNGGEHCKAARSRPRLAHWLAARMAGLSIKLSNMFALREPRHVPSHELNMFLIRASISRGVKRKSVIRPPFLSSDEFPNYEVCRDRDRSQNLVVVDIGRLIPKYSTKPTPSNRCYLYPEWISSEPPLRKDTWQRVALAHHDDSGPSSRD